jgi:hypothetical protein
MLQLHPWLDCYVDGDTGATLLHYVLENAACDENAALEVRASPSFC